MRGFSRHLVSRLALAGALLVAPAVASAAPRSSPTRSSSGVFVQIRGIEYLSVAELARRTELRVVWVQTGRRVQLSGTGRRIELEVDSREASVDGLRVFLGEPPRMYKRTLYLSKIDAERYVGPMAGEYGRTVAPAVRVVALDAGHGGKDTGKINGRLKLLEKTCALDVVLRLKKLLEAQGFRVVLTRSDDRFLELADRPALAAKHGADLFVSVHFNSVESSPQRVTGIEVFTMTPQYQYSTDDYKREGTSDARVFNPGNVWDAWNSVAAHQLQRRLLADLKASDRGIKHQRWAVLRLAECPAILVEGGYLSNDGEARKIATPAYRQDLAEALAAGIKGYAATVAKARAAR